MPRFDSTPLRASVFFACALLLGCAAAAAAPGSPERPSQSQEPPALVLLLVVDQLRADLLDQYDALFTGGLRRLLDRGRVFENTTHDHAVTETAPGHATIATGTYPLQHGVVANIWWERVGESWHRVFNVVDPYYQVLGDSTGSAGAPDRLERTALPDWLLEEHPRAKVTSLSGKDRAAVLLGGKSKSTVYWFSSRHGRFVTSSYYRDEDPDWVSGFNSDRLPAFLEDSVWTSTIPVGALAQSRPDTAAFEGDGVHTWFPHQRRDGADEDEPGPSPAAWFATVPALDQATLDLAEAAVTAQGLGQDATPDLLAVSLSQTDRVGHAYGPRSREQLDNLLRLDRALGRFFEFLDASVGNDRYVVAFTADHGVLDMPEHLVEEGSAGRRLSSTELRQLEEILGEVARKVGRDGEDALAFAMAERAPELDWISDAVAMRRLMMTATRDSLMVLTRNSVYPGRNPGVLGRFGVALRMSEGTLDWAWPRGTTHGSPYYYDRHVPLIFMGPGIEAGRDRARVATVDIAPTLADLLGIARPSDTDGRALTLVP